MKASGPILISTRQLKVLPNNPRTITQAALNTLCDSIRQNGYWEHRPAAVEPIAGTDEYTVLDGNQRLKAMRRLKRPQLLCTIYEDLTETEREEIILRGNINNGEWDTRLLASDFSGVDFAGIGLDIELPEPPQIETPVSAGDSQEQDDDTVETEEDNKKQKNLEFYYKMIGDYIYPSNNEFDIPTLLSDNQPIHLELPFAPWGAEARYKKGITTYHFYVEDYRFEQLFKDPIKLLLSGCRAIVEPNCSIHDQTPMAYAIYQTYRKRYLCRYLQECGIQIWVDLNVSPHFEEVNVLGVPDGYNAFCTRGVTGWIETTERHWQMAQRISGLQHPNMFVYGGGDDVIDWCKSHDVVHVKEYMNRRRKDEK